MAVTRMHHHTRLFIKHQHIIILVNNVEWNVLRKDFQSPSLVRHHKCDDITRTHYIIGLDYFIVHTDVVSLDRKLDSVTRGVLHMGGQILVHTHWSLALVDVKAVVLEHLLLFVLKFEYIVVLIYHYFLAGMRVWSKVKYKVTSSPIRTVTESSMAGTCL